MARETHYEMMQVERDKVARRRHPHEGTSSVMLLKRTLPLRALERVCERVAAAVDKEKEGKS